MTAVFLLWKALVKGAERHGLNSDGLASTETAILCNFFRAKRRVGLAC